MALAMGKQWVSNAIKEGVVNQYEFVS